MPATILDEANALDHGCSLNTVVPNSSSVRRPLRSKLAFTDT